MPDSDRFRSFGDFYPYYLSEHSNPVCRALHYVGTMLGAGFLLYGLGTSRYWFVVGGLLVGYAFAWVGHFFFEHNRPATFKYPFWSFMGDWVMLRDFLAGKFRSST